MIKRTDDHIEGLLDCLTSRQEIEFHCDIGISSKIKGIVIIVGFGGNIDKTKTIILVDGAWIELASKPETQEERVAQCEALFRVFGSEIKRCRYLKVTAMPNKPIVFSFECYAATSAQS